jgi:hypothetical protein
LTPGRRRRPCSPAHARGATSMPATRCRVITVSPCKPRGHREWGLRPGAPPPPCCNCRLPASPSHSAHAEGQGAWGMGAGPHSRCDQPAPENTVLMAQRWRAKYGAPRAWGRRTYPGPPARARHWQAAHRERQRRAEKATLKSDPSPPPAARSPPRRAIRPRVRASAIRAGCESPGCATPPRP